MKKERIDKLLTDLGFAESRTKAHAMIMAGTVLVDEKRVSKPSELFPPMASIRIKGETPDSRYVGRGGLKLEAALDQFNIATEGLACLDIGSSTGGFTDCLLQHGAASVVALDVGTNQLAWKLRNDPRVVVRENTNARTLTAADFDRSFDLIVMDVSFISATKILPALKDVLSENGKIIVLIKPQFEVGKGEVGKGGIVREAEKHDRVVAEVNAFAEGLGLGIVGTIESPITGAEGNREFLSCYELPSSSSLPESAPRLVEDVDYYFEGGLMVLTESFLLRRGYCCGSGCRHCPYPEGDQSKKSSSSL
jgi:23S rRNA (cytidine1920-2'-O)/16S rRNA (cytidine1409-2'-O)-methyltransferase